MCTLRNGFSLVSMMNSNLQSSQQRVSELLIHCCRQAWCTKRRLPVQWQGVISGLSSSPSQWQILHTNKRQSSHMHCILKNFKHTYKAWTAAIACTKFCSKVELDQCPYQANHRGRCLSPIICSEANLTCDVSCLSANAACFKFLHICFLYRHCKPDTRSKFRRSTRSTRIISFQKTK